MDQTGNGLSITIKDLSHEYKGGTVALDRVNMDIRTGLFGLLGPNGAGKSTLMRIICTLLVPTEGSVTVGGYDVVNEREHVRPLLGYLPQEFSAWRLHRVGEVLDILATVSGLENKKTQKIQVLEILESVGLGDVINRKVKKLSGGMVRRLGVAQALIHNPRILVVDEPTVGLDPEERINFRQMMTKLGRDRIIILSTHIVADLGSGCNDMALINKGRVEFRGSPTELIKKAKGSVFEITVTPEQYESGIIPNYEIVSQEKNSDGITLRVVSINGDLPAGATAVDNPNLEEAYLAFMASKGQTVNSAGVDRAEAS